MTDLFSKEGSKKAIDRINNLNADTNGLWGKMTVSQMLAHCCVPYEYVFEDKHDKPGVFKKLLLKLFVKSAVVGPKPYKRNSPTAPDFIISDERIFEEEKERLVDYINKTKALGANYFDNKESHSFGVLSKEEWNMMFSKHLDHHLTQFGV